MKEERDIKENKGRLSGEAEIDEALELLRQMEAVDKRRGYERVVRPVKLRLRRMRMWRKFWLPPIMSCGKAFLPWDTGLTGLRQS